MKLISLVCILYSVFCFLAEGAVSLSGKVTLAGKVNYGATNLIDAESQSYFDRVVVEGGVLSEGHKSAVNSFVLAAKANGYWTNLVDCSPFAGNSLTAALVKLKYPSYASSNCVNVNFVEGDYAITNGIKGGATKYLTTGINMTNIGPNGGLSVWLGENNIFQPPTGYLIGGTTPTPMIMFTTWQLTGAWGGGLLTPMSTYSNYSSGLYHVWRDNSSSNQIWLNGQRLSISATSSTTSSNTPINVFASGTGASSTTNRLGFYAIDAGQWTATTARLFGLDVMSLIAGLNRNHAIPDPQIYVPLYGQSLSIGTSSGGVLSTTQTNQNRTSTFGPTGLSPASGPGIEGIQAQRNFPLLVEYGNESPAAGFANALTRNTGSNVTVASYGVGGQPYAQLAQGTLPYTNLIGRITEAKLLSPAYYGSFRVPGVIIVHGESDSGQPGYQSMIQTWQANLQTNINTAAGTSLLIPLFHSQFSSWSLYSGSPSLGNPAILAAYEADPTKHILVTPKYFLSYADGVHLVNTSYRWLGEYYAKVWKHVIHSGLTWQPLYPTNIALVTTNITLTFTKTNLVLDTSLVSVAANYGFEYSDSTTSATISTVSLAGSTTNQVIIGLSAVPTGASKTIGYAHTATNNTGSSTVSGPRGNLRDNDTSFATVTTNTLYNWCVHFLKAVP